MRNAVFTYEEAVEKIDAIEGKPTVVEAQWDGDTQGWFLCMFVTVEKGILKKTVASHYLGTISLGNDIRLFQGIVPPYPEAKVAQEIGEKLKEKYGLEFFFPSPDKPDDDCPRWSQRHLAINCEDCNKLIIPTDSPYLPKEVCFNCHLVRERNQRIIDEEPHDDGVNMYLHKNGEFKRLGYCSNFESFKIAPFIKDKVEAIHEKVSIEIVTISQPEIEKLIQDLEIEIDKQLLEYEKPEIDKRISRFVTIQKVSYKGKEFELADRFNSHHENLRGLIVSFDIAKKAFAENLEYKIYFKKGITYRDDSVLRFINYSGKVQLEQVYEKFNGIISSKEVDGTLNKLVKIDCLKLKYDEVEVTEIGKNIL
jgi:hypothetical protein